MVKIVARVAPVVLILSCVTALAVPSASAGSTARRPSAHASPALTGALSAYTWSEGVPTFNYNGQAGLISFSNPSTGFYQVTFANMGPMIGGIVQVTPYDDTGTCSVGGWGPSGGDLTVSVDCYSLSGSPAESLFDLIVTQPHTTPPGTFDYSFVYKNASSGTLTGAYQFNSAHKANKVKHLRTGRYQVTFGGRASSGTKGTVKVSSYGGAAGDCAATGWHGTSKGQVVNVDCNTASGHPVNRDFTVTYAGRASLMGLADFPVVNALIGSTGKVMTQTDNQPGAHVTVTHSATGTYLVQLNKTTEVDSGGDVQISPITSSKAHCVVVGWNGGTHVKTVVHVHCFNGHGHSVNSAFTLQFVEAFLT